MCSNGWVDFYSILFGSSRENLRRKVSDLECSYSKVLLCYICKYLCVIVMVGVKIRVKKIWVGCKGCLYNFYFWGV